MTQQSTKSLTKKQATQLLTNGLRARELVVKSQGRSLNALVSKTRRQSPAAKKAP